MVGLFLYLCYTESMQIIKTRSFELAVVTRGDRNAKKLAFALPGLLDTKDYAHLQSHIDYLAGKGFLAISFDPPGTWESPGDISLYSASNYLKAIHELIEHFGNKPTFAMGHSRGATMSVAIGVTNPNVFAFAPVMPSHIRGDYLGKTNKDWQKQGFRLEERDLPPGGPERPVKFDLPYSFFEDQIKYNYEQKLKDCDKPKLFIYGDSDTNATPELVKGIYEGAGQPKEIVGIKSDHNYRNHTDLINEVNQIVGKFLDRI